MSDLRTIRLARRELVTAALTAGVLVALPGAAVAQGTLPSAADPTDVVRRLMILSSQNALARLAQPNGFLTSTVARFGLPVLFVRRGGAPAGPLAEPQFRDALIQRLNIHAEAGARGASTTVAAAARTLPITDPAGILRGRGPTAATSAMRLEMASGLVNALRAPIEQALVAAQDPVVAQAIAVLPGVTLGDVAQAIALAADNGIWYEIGAAEADIRANPAASGDAVLVASLPGPSTIVPQAARP